jgi:hypothetical protein
MQVEARQGVQVERTARCAGGGTARCAGGGHSKVCRWGARQGVQVGAQQDVCVLFIWQRFPQLKLCMSDGLVNGF